MPLSRTWFADNLGQHVEGFHLEDDAGQVIGHIYWARSDKALVPYRIEDRVAFIYCEWVQRQHRGRGGLRMLFDAFVDFLRADGYKGILVDGTDYEDCMHQRHFARRGFVKGPEVAPRLTEAGRAFREQVERDTDRYFFAPWACLDEAQRVELAELLTRLRGGLRESRA